MSDFERPLNDRGRLAAPFMGEYLAQHELIPDALICSPANRAMQTAILVRENAGITSEIKYDDRIYDASLGQLIKVVSEIKDDIESAMLIGHNPGLESLVNYLSGRAAAMPTAAVAVIDLGSDQWIEPEKNSGELIEMLLPRELMK